jgi:hypothetical protein
MPSTFFLPLLFLLLIKIPGRERIAHKSRPPKEKKENFACFFWRKYERIKMLGSFNLNIGI